MVVEAGHQQVAQDALDHLVNVDALVAQVGVVHLFEDFTQTLALGLERPLGVAFFLPHRRRGCRHQHLVVENQQVGVEETRGLGRGIGRDMVADGAQLTARGLDRAVQALDLGFDLVARDRVLRNFRQVAL